MFVMLKSEIWLVDFLSNFCEQFFLIQNWNFQFLCLFVVLSFLNFLFRLHSPLANNKEITTFWYSCRWLNKPSESVKSISQSFFFNSCKISLKKESFSKVRKRRPLYFLFLFVSDSFFLSPCRHSIELPLTKISQYFILLKTWSSSWWFRSASF